MRILDLLPEKTATTPFSKKVVGILPGEGVGPELLSLCRRFLDVIAGHGTYDLEIRTGGLIGDQSKLQSGKELSEEVLDFCRQVFAEGGAILAGPGGGRFVYDSRREMDLFFKINPLFYFPELADSTRLKFDPESSLDVLIVRDNIGGLYQGKAHVDDDANTVHHRFSYTKADVQRVLKVAVQAALRREKKLTVIAKNSGVPEISRLWFECAEEAVAGTGVELRQLDMDYAAYQFMSRPEEFDVIAIPNCFGDILADLGGIFMASRGNTYGASFNGKGEGIFQTNHGSAHALTGKDTANPAGQLFSLAMLLRQTFDMEAEAAAIEKSIRLTWGKGYRTPDVMSAGKIPVGTGKMGDLILECFQNLTNKNHPIETASTSR